MFQTGWWLASVIQLRRVFFKGLRWNKYFSSTLQLHVLDRISIMYHLPSVGSTQDEARKILKEEVSVKKVSSLLVEDNKCFAISASEQMNGRGTNGREWIGMNGNCFVTICIPVFLVKFHITVIPLKMATIVSSHVRCVLQHSADGVSVPSDPKVTIKWPNDVLVNDEKIAGILIETEHCINGNDWFLIGVGVNVKHAPTVDIKGVNKGRNATCISNHNQSFIHNDGVDESKKLAVDIAGDMIEFLDLHRNVHHVTEKAALTASIVDKWKRWVEFGKTQELRDIPGMQCVVPLGVEPDGQLRVKCDDGVERLLCSNYLL